MVRDDTLDRDAPAYLLASLIEHGTVGLLPCSQATLNVARRAKSGVLRSLDGHGGSLPKGAVKHEAFALRGRKVVRITGKCEKNARMNG